MKKSIIIIGSGMGGLASGIYGQLNGYQTQIFEMHHSPGGQCTGWQRKGYTFDACIHHLFGCKPGSSIYQLWEELGAVPCDMVPIKECTSIASPEGKMLIDYYDLEKLREHLTDLSPTDSGVIEQYIKGIKLILKNDPLDIMVTGSKLGLVKLLRAMPFLMKWFKMTMKEFGEKFSDPFLRQAFPLLVYSMPDIPIFLHLARHAYGMTNNIQWPVGGAQQFARSIEQRYQELGGTVHYRSKVEQILVLNDKAVGVRLSDGSEHHADYVISNADGRKTIMNMLEGKYLNEKVRDYCKEPPDEFVMAVNVFLGVNRDLSTEPSAVIMLLDKPEIIANHECESLEIQIYSFDKTMAPPGKSTIKIELVSGYDYWKQLYQDKAKYNETKQQVAKQVIDILEKRFPGISSQIEVIDVTTPVTWERYMDGTHGWNNFPNREFDFSFIPKPSGKRYETTLPGLANFYFAGVWVTTAGALHINALSGKKTIQTICKRDGIKFKTK